MISGDREISKLIWDYIIKNPDILNKLPNCVSNINELIPVNTINSQYRVIGIDGSQIYPDRHQGVNCFLLNIGAIEITYGKSNGVKLYSEPTLYTSLDEFEYSQEIVNCRRTDLELKTGFELCKKAYEEDCNTPTLLLFDGSLIFWHLENKDIRTKNNFFQKYIASMDLYYRKNYLMAGYISYPKSKDIVNIMRVILENRLVPEIKYSGNLDQIVDTDIVELFLKPWTRTALYEHKSHLADQYPEQLKPYFFYMDVKDEIVRVEIPAWIAKNDKYFEQVVSIIVDQCHKGYGYPLSLIEAHEQAVVKGADRDFFYAALAKISLSNNKQYSSSIKSLKKKLVGF